jgi:outer membrane lipopolysaccharide assembly protein LptE/RlpB
MLATVVGCGYHLSNFQSQKIGTAQKIWVPFFSNESISPTAQTVLRRAFYDELYSLRGAVPAASQDSADFIMKARMVSYSSKAVSYNSLDQAREFSLAVEVEIEITQKGQSAPFWKGRVKVEKQYPGNRDLALQRNSEEQALDAASRILAHKFISALEESY